MVESVIAWERSARKKRGNPAMSSVFSTAVSGMNAAIARIANAANNIVNVSSTGKLPSAPGEKATSFAPQDVVTISNNAEDLKLGVRTTLVPRDPSYSVAYDPTSPDANAQGLVAAPNVDIAAELVDTMMAKNAYEASAKIISVQKEMDKSLLDALK